ncbi:unnamed protein product [Boreogadus saida]
MDDLYLSKYRYGYSEIWESPPWCLKKRGQGTYINNIYSVIKYKHKYTSNINIAQHKVFVTRVGWILGDLGSLLEAVGVVQFLQRGERAAGDLLGRAKAPL